MYGSINIGYPVTLLSSLGYPSTIRAYALAKKGEQQRMQTCSDRWQISILIGHFLKKFVYYIEKKVRLSNGQAVIKFYYTVPLDLFIALSFIVL